MAIRPFLAMTASEIRNTAALPSKLAWMACHFSPYGRGLSNLPPELPEDSILTVDDITPIRGHDPEVITCQLMQCMEKLHLCGILLDFQRPNNPETADLVRYLSQSLLFPVAVSESYGAGTALPVFVSPVPPSVPLQAHLSPWKGHEIWMDISPWGEVLTLTEDGCKSVPLPPWESPEEGYCEETLHCHYRTTVNETSAQFTLWRTEEDVISLLREAETLGVTHAAGLFQELYSFFA